MVKKVFITTRCSVDWCLRQDVGVEIPTLFLCQNKWVARRSDGQSPHWPKQTPIQFTFLRFLPLTHHSLAKQYPKETRLNEIIFQHNHSPFPNFFHCQQTTQFNHSFFLHEILHHFISMSNDIHSFQIIQQLPTCFSLSQSLSVESSIISPKAHDRSKMKNCQKLLFLSGYATVDIHPWTQTPSTKHWIPFILNNNFNTFNDFFQLKLNSLIFTVELIMMFLKKFHRLTFNTKLEDNIFQSFSFNSNVNFFSFTNFFIRKLYLKFSWVYQWNDNFHIDSIDCLMFCNLNEMMLW